MGVSPAWYIIIIMIIPNKVGVSPAWYSSQAESSLCSRSVHLFPLPWMEEAVRGSLRWALMVMVMVIVMVMVLVIFLIKVMTQKFISVGGFFARAVESNLETTAGSKSSSSSSSSSSYNQFFPFSLKCGKFVAKISAHLCFAAQQLIWGSAAQPMSGLALEYKNKMCLPSS